jgi:superfamily II RNA helicase
MVEILFSRNLIKILFATETFAMGGEYFKGDAGANYS